jgi:hypothetical protein
VWLALNGHMRIVLSPAEIEVFVAAAEISGRFDVPFDDLAKLWRENRKE